MCSKKKCKTKSKVKIKSKKSEYNLFTLLNNLTVDKTNQWHIYKTIYSPYIVNRFLSMNTQTVYYAQLMNELFNLSAEDQYNFYLSVLPKKKMYFAYPKKSKDKLIDNVMKYYKISREKAKLFISTSDIEKLKAITADL